MKPGELDDFFDDEDEISHNKTNIMNSIPKGWTIATNMKIDGEPINEQTFTSLNKAIESAKAEESRTGTKYGGINEYENGTFCIMKSGQVFLPFNGCTAYTPPLSSANEL